MSDRDKDPHRDNERNKRDDLRPPGGDHNARRDIGPIERKVQKAHPSDPARDELDGIVMWSEPAEDRKRGREGKDVFWEECPKEAADEDEPEDTNLFPGDIEGLTPFPAKGSVHG